MSRITFPYQKAFGCDQIPIIADFYTQNGCPVEICPKLRFYAAYMLVSCITSVRKSWVFGLSSDVGRLLSVSTMTRIASLGIDQLAEERVRSVSVRYFSRGLARPIELSLGRLSTSVGAGRYFMLYRVSLVAAVGLPELTDKGAP